MRHFINNEYNMKINYNYFLKSVTYVHLVSSLVIAINKYKFSFNLILKSIKLKKKKKKMQIKTGY